MVLLWLLPLRCPHHVEVAAVGLMAPASVLEGVPWLVAMAGVLALQAAAVMGNAATASVVVLAVAIAAAAVVVASCNRAHCLLGMAVEPRAQAHIAYHCTSQSQLQQRHP